MAEQQQLCPPLERDGRVAAVDQSGDCAAQYFYDEAGDLSRIVESSGSDVSFAYDDRRRLISVAHGEGEFTTYSYGCNNRLSAIDDRGLRREFEHDEKGRLIREKRGDAGAVVYRYDAEGRVIEGRTSRVSTAQEFDDAGRVAAIHQTFDGTCLTMRLNYDAAGRLASLWLPGSRVPIRYSWDERAWPATIHAGDRLIARFDYRAEEKFCRIHFSNDVADESWADAIDGRRRRQVITRGEQTLTQRELEYGASGRLRQDGQRRYEYDAAGRLAGATCSVTAQAWTYEYDGRDNRVASDAGQFICDARDRLTQVRLKDGGVISLRYDRWGRLAGKRGPCAEIVYRYDDAGQLVEVLSNGDRLARFVYDHKGRLAVMQSGGGVERYLYGPADELFAVTDEAGEPLRLCARTPFGCVAEIHGPIESGVLFFVHEDERGVCRMVTDERGEVVASPRVDPFGGPLSLAPSLAPWSFAGRRWNSVVSLYYFGARWYDPTLGRFLTPDSYTCRPDDARLANAYAEATAQVLWREYLLTDWLKSPRTRHPYAYCGNDPVNCVDPNGHWSFGYVLLTLLGAIWTLPNTLFGLLAEITCLLGEVVRWMVFAVTIGNVSWETPGFDAVASGRLNAFALVFTGGWLGSFPRLLGVTLGNVMIVYKDWRNVEQIKEGGDISPAAYNGKVTLTREESFFEHELRHTNQYGWFGPFFHLGLPLFGIYEWDLIINGGYWGSWLEKDANDYGGDVNVP